MPTKLEIHASAWKAENFAGVLTVYYIFVVSVLKDVPPVYVAISLFTHIAHQHGGVWDTGIVNT